MAKRVMLLGGSERNRAALRRAIEEAGAVIVPAAASSSVADGETGGAATPLDAVLCEINQGVSPDELRRKVTQANSLWSGVPVIAYHPYEYQEHDDATRNGYSTNSMLLKYLGFRVVVEDLTQLGAALDDLEDAASPRRGDGSDDDLNGADGPVSEHGATLLSAVKLPLGEEAAAADEGPAAQQLRDAFQLVAALHSASGRRQAAEAALAGLQKMIGAERWAIRTVVEPPENAGDDLELLIALDSSESQPPAAPDDRRRQKANARRRSSAAALEAAKTIRAAARREDGRANAAVPLMRAERLYGVIEVERSGAEPFGQSELELLSSLADPIACALANAERIARAERLSLTDDLTKLHNARYLRQFLNSETKRARRYNSPVGVIFLDLDNFKRINDVHGHLVGSHILSELSTVVLRSVRDTDVVARYGGDEFVVVLPQSKAEQAVFVAERMREKIAKWTFNGGRELELRVTASFGVAAFPRNASTLQQLLDSADGAMYQAKADGKNCVRLALEYSPENFTENVFSS